MQSAENPKCCFAFLHLPGELRNKIYKLLLMNTCRVPSGAYGAGSGISTKLSICSAILRVSKQIYQEAIPLLYTLNRFNAHPSLLNRLPFYADADRRVLSTTRSLMIKRFYIAVRLDIDPRWTDEDLATAFSGVKELGLHFAKPSDILIQSPEVEAWQPSYGITDMANLMGFAQIRGVGKAKVHGCGVSPAFSQWLEMAMQSPEGTIVAEWPPNDWNTWTNGNR